MWQQTLAINSHLKNLPEGGLIPGQKPFENLPPGESAEGIFANLPDQKESGGTLAIPPSPVKEVKASLGEEGGLQGTETESNEQSSDGIPDSLDDHSGWGSTSQEIKEIATEQFKDIMRKASEDCACSNSWGSVSHSARTKILKSLETKLDWKKVLRYFVKASQRAKSKFFDQVESTGDMHTFTLAENKPCC